MTTGARTSPERTSSLIASPARARSPSPSQQMRAGNPWKWTRCVRTEPPLQKRVVGKQLLQSRVDHRDVALVARERRLPRNGRLPGRRAVGYSRDEARICERLLYAGLIGLPRRLLP